MSDDTPTIVRMAKAMTKDQTGREDGWANMLSPARAALEALRRPSQAVQDRLQLVPGGWGPGSWLAGLEAALEEPDTEDGDEEEG